MPGNNSGLSQLGTRAIEPPSLYRPLERLGGTRILGRGLRVCVCCGGPTRSRTLLMCVDPFGARPRMFVLGSLAPRVEPLLLKGGVQI